MGKLLRYLAKCCRLPMRGGFDELDRQIEKLRILRDSYQTALQERQSDQKIDLRKDGKRLCMQ